MSRIAKKPILVPTGTDVKVASGEIIVKGKGGELKRMLHPAISVAVDNGQVAVTSKQDSRLAKALLGTYASHVKNMIAGVNQPFSKKLQIEGIGYRVELAGKQVKMQMGFSHPVLMPIPDGIAVAVEKNIVTISGIDKEKVGQFAANIRSIKKPEPYKGKGIRYEGEVVRQKAGKKAV